MAFLPPQQLTLTGGCLCSAIRYKITVPSLASRPLIPNSLPTPIHPPASDGTSEVDTRFPVVDIDHCNSCRVNCGGLAQCWFICPQSWVEFTLQLRRPESESESARAAAPPDNKDAAAPTEAEKVHYYPTAGVVSNPSADVLNATYLGHYPSSPNVHRCFCTRCGTGLTWCSSEDRGPKWTLGPMVDVAVGTLDRGSIELARPDRHGWWEDGVGWIKRLLTEGDAGRLLRHPQGGVYERVEDVWGSLEK